MTLSTVQGMMSWTRFSIHKRFVLLATHNGDLMEIPATGKPIRVTGISIIRFVNGKAMEEWIEEDSLGLMHQLGVLH